jgi:hypothetical protein
MFRSIIISSFFILSSVISFGAMAESNSNNNSMVAASPSIAEPSVYGQDKQEKNSNLPTIPSTTDVLISKPRDVIGGSEHQKSSITPYLGINY